MYVYILELANNKFYIGRTTNIHQRLADHSCGQGSVWTRLYPPLDVFDILVDCDPFDEDKYVLKYMAMYGIDAVRGGSFSTIELSNSTREHINKCIQTATDACYYCGCTDHFIHTCPYLLFKW